VTKKEHKYWRDWWLKDAADRVKNKDWLGASDAYGAAAHHDAVLDAIKSHKPDMQTTSKPECEP
jgi:hypothetical protein